MRELRYGRVVTEHLKRTTLHGFKYLTSVYYYDRVFWAVACCASACCAGGLCAVLWAHYLQRPALLTLQNLREDQYNRIPLVICPPPEIYTQRIFGLDREPSPHAKNLSIMLQDIIKKTPLKPGEGEMIDEWLQEKQTNIAEALVKSSPECEDLLTFCRWQHRRTHCGELFYKQLTEWGACCMLNQSMLRTPSKQIETTSRLELTLQCANTFMDNGCTMYTSYEGEDAVEPVRLHHGIEYIAHMRLIVTEADEGMLDIFGECVREPGYSKDLCGLKCLEILCGCSHPLRPLDRKYMPECTVAQISCLLSDHHFHNNDSCPCPPSCTAYTMDLSYESSPMSYIQYAVDPIYASVDTKTSIVLRVSLRHSRSNIIALVSTQSWLTLLSSLGGVFNMFLGVGLFSALELLFLMLMKLPIAMRTSPEVVRIDI